MPAQAFLKRPGTRAMAILPIRDRVGTLAVFFAHSDQPRSWAAEDLTFLYNVGDRVARWEAEALQRFLNLELSHRMKNTPAMVHAVARQTLRSIPDQVPVEAFASRLRALSSANDVLPRQHWTTAKMGDVVGNIQGIDRFNFTGPEVMVARKRHFRFPFR